MPTPISPNFTPFTNTRILFADVAAVNNFFNSLTYTITAANLPEASVNAIGAVKQIVIAAPVVPEVTLDSLTTVADDGATQNVTPTYASYLTLIAQVDYLKSYIEALYTQLNSQGYVGEAS